MFDLLIKNARIADGSGRAIFRGSVGVKGGIIRHVDRKLPDEGAGRVIDADGLVLAPGFIDPHTHLDAQVLWDKQVTPSCWHGVTTVLIGNCGVGLMPAHESTRERMLRDLVNVEGIDYDVLATGVQWNWSTPGQYFNHVERNGLGANIAALISMTPLRYFAMGAAAAERAANADEISNMAAAFKGALADGAFGFSTDTLANHLGFGGLPLACRNQSRDELRALCNILRSEGRGLIAIALDSLRQGVQYISDHDVGLLRFLVQESERQVTFLPMVAKPGDLEFRDRQLARLGDLADKVVPQVSPMPIVFLQTLRRPFKFSEFPAWRTAHNASYEDQLKMYADPAFRRAAKEEQKGHLRKIPWDRTSVLAARRADLAARYNNRTLADIGRAEDKDPLDAMLDISIQDELRTLLEFASANLDRDVVRTLLQEPKFMLGISDAGAHVDQVCDLRYPTFLLGEWVREQQALSLEFAVWKLSGQPATVIGLPGRGFVRCGYHADLTLFDPKTVNAGAPEFVEDLPAGGRRLISVPTGIVATFIGGVQVMDNGKETGALPGRIVRSTEKVSG